MICPPDHRHAETVTCRSCHRCECEPCRTAYNKVYAKDQKARRRAKAYGTFVPNVSAVGTQRRIQGLQVLGWRLPDIAKEGGWGTWEAVRRILIRKTVTPETRDRVAAVARVLVAQGRGPSTVTAQRALAKGWVSPLAWDDIENDEAPVVTTTTDDIDEVAVTLACQGVHVKLNPAERREAVRRLHAERYTDPLIAETIGCGTKTALLIRQELGLKTWPYSELVKRGAA